jgi:hypothetical protein
MIRPAIVFVVAVTLACGSATGCTGSTAPRQTLPISADEAAQFGELTLPEGVEVLGTSSDGAIDTRYELSLRVDEKQLAALLKGSRFTAAVAPSNYGRERTVVAGPPMSSATDLRYGQDRVVTADHGIVTRDVFEDHRSPGEIYVHLSLFTT